MKFKEHVEEAIGFMVIVLGMHFTNTNGLETIQTVKLFVGPSPCKFLTANCCWWRCAVGPQQHSTNTAVVSHAQYQQQPGGGDLSQATLSLAGTLLGRLVPPPAS